MPQQYRGRLAPAPTGALHIGNARTFLAAWVRARQHGGRLILRVEDLDHPKVKPGAVQQALDDLAWLGLDWDEGPYIQSCRMDVYAEVLDRLQSAGRVYACTCTRKEAQTALSAPNDGADLREAGYAGTCRGRWRSVDEARAATGREPALRFVIDPDQTTVFDDVLFGRQASRLADWSGDFVIGRGGSPAYQLAVVVDDHAMGVTEVVRGADLLASTHRQLALYAALGWEPPRFMHASVLAGPDGRRLAKRHGDTRISALRQPGQGPEQGPEQGPGHRTGQGSEQGPERVLGWLAYSWGWFSTPREASLADILAHADFDILPPPPQKICITPQDLTFMGF